MAGSSPAAPAAPITGDAPVKRRLPLSSAAAADLAAPGLNLQLLIGALVAALLVLQYLLWLAEDGVRQTHAVRIAIQAQSEENAGMNERNRALEADVADLKNGLMAVEERARSEVGMIRPDETFYRILDQPLPKSAAINTRSGPPPYKPPIPTTDKPTTPANKPLTAAQPPAVVAKPAATAAKPIAPKAAPVTAKPAKALKPAPPAEPATAPKPAVAAKPLAMPPAPTPPRIAKPPAQPVAAPQPVAKPPATPPAHAPLHIAKPPTHPVSTPPR